MASINLGTFKLASTSTFNVNNYNLVFSDTPVNFTIKEIPLDGSVGTVTVNLGKIEAKDGKLVLCCDSRIPVSFTVDSIEEIPGRIADMTEGEYEVIRSNTMKISDRLRKGKYTTRALKRVLGQKE